MNAANLKRRLLAAVVSPMPVIPEAGELVWSWFRALHDARPYSFGAPNPIGFAEIEAYARLHRWPLEPRHVDLIRALDAAWLKKVTAGGKDAPRYSSQPLTPGIFDAISG